MIEKIPIAHDGSEGAQRAFNKALEPAMGASVDMIGLEERSIHDGETIDEVGQEIEERNGYFEELAAQCKRRAALRGIDLLALGYAGHSRIYEHLWSGTSRNLARLAPCSVLVVK